MTKSVIKAMDAISAIAPTLGDYAVNDFVVTGYSKRGLVTWLAAAIDPRIRAIAPGVIDFLNVVPSMENQFSSYGEYVPQLQTLVDLGVMERMRTPEFRDLASIIDPYEYRDRLDLPKLLLNSSGDQFFLPDSARFYYRDLPGEKLIRYAPNTDHSLENSVTSIFDTLYSLLGWYQSILLEQQRPQIDWQLNDNELVASASIAPQLARVWRAHNPLARDFRKATIGEAWEAEVIAPEGDGHYRVSLPQPAQGYAASYIEFVYQGPSGLPVSYSTRIFITPDTMPYQLDDPLYNPELAHYWEQQLYIALSTDGGDISRAEFDSYLPVPVFDTYVSETGQLSEILDSGFLFNQSSADFARRQCMATRLNVKSGQIGWYSDVDLGYLGSGKAWEFYQFADAVQQHGLSWMAGSVCFKLNQL
jgi:PhoPQ-activated pathogenicity-related protein